MSKYRESEYTDTLVNLQRMRTMFPGRCMILTDDDGNRCYKMQHHSDACAPFISMSHKKKVYENLNDGKELIELDETVAFCE